jgi:RNA recognition motif-containing protein
VARPLGEEETAPRGGPAGTGGWSVDVQPKTIGEDMGFMNNDCRIFVGNLPWSARDADVVSMLSDLGFSPKEARVVMEQDSGRSRGFAFAEFDSPEEASEAITTVSGHEYGGRELVAAPANDRGGREGRRGDRAGRSSTGGDRGRSGKAKSGGGEWENCDPSWQEEADRRVSGRRR